MSDTVRQSIMDNLVTRLQAISMMNGYYADYSYIDEWRLTALEPSEFPAILCRDESQDVLSYQFDEIANWALHVTVNIAVKEDSPGEYLRNYIADIYKCLGTDLLCGGYATGIEPKGDSIDMSQEDHVYGIIEIKFDVLYSSRAWNSTALV